jgi:hypothetical protein
MDGVGLGDPGACKESVGPPGSLARWWRNSADAVRDRSRAILLASLIAALKVGPIRLGRHGFA